MQLRKIVLYLLAILPIYTGVLLAQRLDGGVRLDGSLISMGLGTTATSANNLLIRNTTNQIGIRINPTGLDAHQPMIVFHRSDGVVTGMIDEAGTFRTKLSISVSGSFSTTLNTDGSINTRASGVSGLSDMIDAVSDTSYGIVSKGSSVPGQLFTALDQNGNHVWNVAPLGCHQWGVGNFAALDSSLCRTAAAVLAVGNGTAGDTSGAIAPRKVEFSAFTFANINAAGNLTQNGDIGYCSDCTIANPCAGAGSGALAKRLNGVNVCN